MWRPVVRRSTRYRACEPHAHVWCAWPFTRDFGQWTSRPWRRQNWSTDGLHGLGLHGLRRWTLLIVQRGQTQILVFHGGGSWSVSGIFPSSLGNSWSYRSVFDSCSIEQGAPCGQDSCRVLALRSIRLHEEGSKSGFQFIFSTAARMNRNVNSKVYCCDFMKTDSFFQFRELVLAFVAREVIGRASGHNPGLSGKDGSLGPDRSPLTYGKLVVRETQIPLYIHCTFVLAAYGLAIVNLEPWTPSRSVVNYRSENDLRSCPERRSTTSRYSKRMNCIHP